MQVVTSALARANLYNLIEKIKEFLRTNYDYKEKAIELLELLVLLLFSIQDLKLKCWAKL